jgi:hypothetical protein
MAVFLLDVICVIAILGTCAWIAQNKWSHRSLDQFADWIDESNARPRR